ncbi:MAG: hypothetical protein FWH34_04270 [Desulfovibrionaceae bacterium]|nr:hypothetical protein [Desulfovibrionaceae bacterium]
MRFAFLKALVQLAQNNPDVILLTGDLGFGDSDFARNFPANRILNAGISEQNMMSVAAGLALSGKIVFVYSIANFTTLRCLEQLRNNAAYPSANVKAVAVGVGVGYGAMGATHHATEDISILRAIPDVTIFSPSDNAETHAATIAAVERPGCCYLRLSKGEPDLTALSPTADPAEDIFHARKICDGGSNTCVFVTGAVAGVALKAAKAVGAPLFTFAAVKPIDEAFIRRAACTYKTILTFEENQVQGGFGGAVSEIVAGLQGERASVRRIGFEDTFAYRVGSRAWILEEYGISATRAAQFCDEF